MRAVVLVGGFGTRLQPLTCTTPKQMLPVAGRPLIERVLEHLGGHGVEEAVLSLGYRPEVFTQAYPGGTCAGVRLRYAVEAEPLDTAGAIRFAAAHAGIDDRFLVVNGDVLSDLDLGALVDFHRAAGAEGTISLTRVEDPSPFGVVTTTGAGRVTAFVEKPAPGAAPGDLVSAGHYVLEPSVLDRIPGGRPVSVEREVFPAMVEEGTLHARAGGTYWLGVDTPERYLQASLDLLDGAGGVGVEPGATTVVDGEVVLPSLLADGVVVAAGAVVDRSVLGAGCRLDPGARVDRSVLLPGAVVGSGATVHRSILGAGAAVGAGAVVDRHSVIGDGVEVAAGAVLSGARVPGPKGATPPAPGHPPPR
ncbi:MAG: sugar phosphate nucleotidyltransferase [Acidimicrobiales bacterium]